MFSTTKEIFYTKFETAIRNMFAKDLKIFL